MFAWIAENLATILITLVLAVIVTLIILSLVKNKKKGKTSCGCNCAHCAMAGSCHQKEGQAAQSANGSRKSSICGSQLFSGEVSNG